MTRHEKDIYRKLEASVFKGSNTDNKYSLINNQFKTKMRYSPSRLSSPIMVSHTSCSIKLIIHVKPGLRRTTSPVKTKHYDSSSSSRLLFVSETRHAVRNKPSIYLRRRMRCGLIQRSHLFGLISVLI